jgi:hypothetical protein
VGPVVDDNRGGDFAASGTRWLACGMPDEGNTSDETRETVRAGDRHTSETSQCYAWLCTSKVGVGKQTQGSKPQRQGGSSGRGRLGWPKAPVRFCWRWSVEKQTLDEEGR